jgi:hypothetical protein
MEVIFPSEMLGFFQTTELYNAEDHTLQNWKWFHWTTFWGNCVSSIALQRIDIYSHYVSPAFLLCISQVRLTFNMGESIYKDKETFMTKCYVHITDLGSLDELILCSLNIRWLPSPCSQNWCLQTSYIHIIYNLHKTVSTLFFSLFFSK